MYYLQKPLGLLSKTAAALGLTLAAGLGFTATPVEQHGALAVKGNQIVNRDGQPTALAGPSLFWSNNGWGADRYYNADVVDYVRDEWNASLIRAAMGVEPEGGYLDDPEGNQAKVERVVDAAIERGMYVLIDWHSHHAEEHPEAAIKFFQKMAKKYGDSPSVIYEIYNEPLADADWSETVKPYAESVIKAIRAIDPDNLIVVGTPRWSQDVDVASEDPITAYENIAYTLHFYAGTHKKALREKAEKAMSNGIALMVTEWGTVNADGDGDVAKKEVERWLKFMRKHNLSHANWSLHDKEEGASILKPGTPADGQCTDAHLTGTGEFVKTIVRDWHE